jgi:hypothetical protein
VQFRPQDGSEWRPGDGLTQPEEKMIANAAVGEWLSGGEGPSGASEMKEWAAERTIRSSVLRHLLISNEWPVDAKGVRLRGVRIHGKLDLEASVVLCPLWLDSCYFDDENSVCLDRASAVSLSLTGCLLAGFAADMLTVRELSLSSSTLTGPLSLSNAEIAGLLSCSGTTLPSADPYGYALNADRIKVGGDLRLDRGFRSDGPIWLAGAAIAGRVSCTGAALAGADPDGCALNADGAKVGSDLYLDEVFRSDGAIWLAGAAIAGALSCRGAFVAASGYDGTALLADGIKVGENVYLDQGFRSEGAIRLAGASIGGSLLCRDAQIAARGAGGEALIADRLTVDGDVSFDGFRADGATSFRSARVSGSVYLKQLTLPDTGTALDASGAQIAGALRWEPGTQIRGRVSLEGAEVGKLEDSWPQHVTNGSWPSDGGLRINGFVYHALGGVPPATLSQRLEWVRSQYRRRGHPEDGDQAGFALQPYEQLAALYRQAGQDAEARAVAITKYRDQRRFGNLTAYRRAGNWLLDKTIQYGYQNWRAAAVMAAVYVVIVLISILAQHHGVIVPVEDTTGLHFLPVATRCTSDYPCFYPAGYAFDVVFPLINVHQAQYWGINAAAPWGWAWVSATWVATALGWTGATFLVAGLTSLGRRN